MRTPLMAHMASRPSCLAARADPRTPQVVTTTSTASPICAAQLLRPQPVACASIGRNSVVTLARVRRRNTCSVATTTAYVRYSSCVATSLCSELPLPRLLLLLKMAFVCDDRRELGLLPTTLAVCVWHAHGNTRSTWTWLVSSKSSVQSCQPRA